MPVTVAPLIVGKNRTLIQQDLGLLIEHLKKGHFAILPTDTGPMLACDALNLKAVDALFVLKGRDYSNPIHVAVSDYTSIDKYVLVNASARRVVNALLPGSLTVVCPKKDTISELLVANTDNLGIRIPDCPATLLICAAAGVPLTATSLNLSGRPAESSVEDTLRTLHWNGPATVYHVIDEHQPVHKRASTVVRITRDFEAEILRNGPIGKEIIEKVMRQQ